MQEDGKIKILIIDDDVLMQELLILGLEMNDFAVVAASDGAKAIELLEDEALRDTLDLIMVDLMMPVMDGMRFLRWLRQDAEIATPVLVLTGMSKPTTRADVMEAGATDLVYKPINVQDLVEKLKRMLGK